MNYLGFSFTIKPYTFNSLRDINSKSLTDIELKLLEKFKDVLVCHDKDKFHNCYYVVDSCENIGIIGLDGNIMVPPIKGKVHKLWKGIIIGDLEFTDDDLWIKRSGDAIKEHNGIGIGHFSAFIDHIDDKDIKVVIPAGKYDDIQVTIKGPKFNFYVAKLDDKNTLRWGVVNSKDEVILPCEYLGIYKKNHKLGFMVGNVGGEYVGSNDISMDEANRLVENKETIARNRKLEWAKVLNTFSESMFTMADIVGQIQAAKSSSEYEDSEYAPSSKSKKGEQYNTSEQQSYNTDKQTYSKYDSMLSAALYGNREASASEIKEWRKKMKNLREKWEKRGKNFPHSANE